MIGLIDSGMGGINAHRELHKLLPEESLLLLTDYAAAPYGTKSREALIEIAEENIARFRRFGAERVLIACCTLSSLFSELSKEAREIAIPIIAPTAEAATAASPAGRVAVIATEATVRSHAFKEALGDACALEMPASKLVGICEAGGGSHPDAKREIALLTAAAAESGADTLILGCTHFHTLLKEFVRVGEKAGITKIISSAREGARELKRILHR